MPVGRPWKDQDEIQKKKIVDALKKNKKFEYMSIQQIAQNAGIDRNTVAKYIPILEKQKKIVSFKVGRWNIYKIKRK